MLVTCPACLTEWDYSRARTPGRRVLCPFCEKAKYEKTKRLRAAAPDMAEALMEARALCADVLDAVKPGDENDHLGPLAAVVSVTIDAALRKAGVE